MKSFKMAYRQSSERAGNLRQPQALYLTRPDMLTPRGGAGIRNEDVKMGRKNKLGILAGSGPCGVTAALPVATPREKFSVNQTCGRLKQRGVWPNSFRKKTTSHPSLAGRLQSSASHLHLWLFSSAVPESVVSISQMRKLRLGNDVTCPRLAQRSLDSSQKRTRM